jgi:hypothetical protein
MTRLRAVPPDGLPPSSIDPAAAHAALDRALNAGAVVLTILYETATEYDWVSVPESQAVAKGLAMNCMDLMDGAAEDE